MEMHCPLLVSGHAISLHTSHHITMKRQVQKDVPPPRTTITTTDIETRTYTGTSTAEVKQGAIQGARRRGWMVLEAGTDYTSIVIAFENNLHAKRYRELIIVDGKGDAQWVEAEPDCFHDPKISEKIKCFKLNTRQV